MRLKPATLAVKVDGRNIGEWCALSVGAARDAADGLRYTGGQALIAAPIVKEVRSRLGFLADVGLGYLTLDRMAGTLAGGEAQHTARAQIGSQLTGCSTSSTGPRSACTTATTGNCCRRCRSGATSGTRWWSWSTTKTRCAPPTGSWTWGRGRGGTAAAWSRPGRRTRSRARRIRSPAATWPAARASPRPRRAGPGTVALEVVGARRR
jgi:hypothetical protein